MIPAVILAAAVVGLALIARAIREQTADLRAIAEEQADERRSLGITEGIRRMDALGKEANR